MSSRENNLEGYTDCSESDNESTISEQSNATDITSETETEYEHKAITPPSDVILNEEGKIIGKRVIKTIRKTMADGSVKMYQYPTIASRKGTGRKGGRKPYVHKPELRKLISKISDKICGQILEHIKSTYDIIELSDDES